ncbi:aspartate aminotransferase family protein [Candidatus Korarchaeum cryptofilum]|jgi:4-aminobutyrate aminotransferase-like enzyme|uniref:Aspartate aminotransferase family protein n=1 Tax=Candidatus Korarchaeum cryptofilum TaxID=498846 RepID=A0A3R9QTH9_9CREN|nr:aspartate aminotransferase family protein [Candidatus Korarchaeum cryptofilum]RSN70895.1 aspartate aminotransferase family protein [Candidatus Korarchaeum cryptofilum]
MQEDMLRRLDSSLMTNLFKTHRIVVKKAKGIYVEDVDGKRYMDFMTVITTAYLGHNPDYLVEAIKEAAENLIAGGSYVYYSEYLLRASEKLLSLFPRELNRVAFKPGGGEAVELALKLARKFTKRQEVLVTMGSYHGRTSGTLTFHGSRKKEFAPLIPGMSYVPYPYCYRCPVKADSCESCSDSILQLIDYYLKFSGNRDYAALIIEPIQGVGGIIYPEDGFFPKLASILRENNSLLIFDEIQTGMGRTGTTWRFEALNVVPDIVVVAKGMTGGLPLAAVVTREEIAASMEPGDEHSTYAAPPLVMAAADATLSHFIENKEAILRNVREVGEYALKLLNELKERRKFVGDVRGKGLMLGIELVKDKESKKPAREETAQLCFDKALKRGLLLATSGWYGNVVRFAPPLTVSKEEVERAVQIMDESLGEIGG